MKSAHQTVTSERIQKTLANLGLGSRREIERWIEQGRILLNGKTAKLGDCYTSGDTLAVDGKPIHFKTRSVNRILGLMYHKPEGEVTTRSDEKGRKTIFDHLPECEMGRWINVGRLDLNTSGLLLLTNYGELANRLMHPRYQMLRKYAVRVRGEVADGAINNLLRGVKLDDGVAKFESIEDAGGKGFNHWYHVTLREGKNREVRRLWESQGVLVSRLIRIQYGPIRLDPKLKAGQVRELRPAELNQLLNETGLPTLQPRKVKVTAYKKKKQHRHKPARHKRGASKLLRKR